MTPAAFTKARALADKLMTTCNPPELWEEVEALTKEECAALDTITLECHVCNHWFPTATMREGSGSQWTCKDCL